MQYNSQQSDIVIVGGGVAGLMLSGKLAALGFKVIVLEKNAKLASGPSTKNEGWLHRGTYHAISIADEQQALRVAQRCIYGYEQILRFCPEAIEDHESQSYALLKDRSRVDEIRDRWSKAGVKFDPLARSQILNYLGSVKDCDSLAAFKVYDKTIDVRILYRKLYQRAILNGAQVALGCKLIDIADSGVVSFSIEGSFSSIRTRIVILASGYEVGSLVKRFIGKDIPVRIYKSHLAITERVSDSGIFYLDPNEAAAMPHGSVSIIGMNEDAKIVHDTNLEVVEMEARNLTSAIDRMFVFNVSIRAFVACLKVDLGSYDENRSLDVNFREVAQNTYILLPGKMTETPYITDVCARIVYNTLGDNIVSERPMDSF